MGNCCSQEKSSESYQRHEDSSSAAQDAAPATWSSPFAAPKLQQVPLSSRDKQQREKTWKATGLVALRDAGMKALPINIENVATEAKVLDAHNNALKDSASIAVLAKCVNLQRLVLSANQFTILPPDVIRCLVNLKYLNMDDNKLTELPDQLGRLDKLELLSVNNNALTALPSTLSSCIKLRKLSCKGNRLTSLPDDLPTELEEINAANNQITTIPVGFRTLIKLTILNLDSNRVSSVPTEVLSDCVSLHTLSLHNNPITPDQLQANPAFEAFEKRRRQKYDKVIGGGAMLSTKGLDEGVDRKV